MKPAQCTVQSQQLCGPLQYVHQVFGVDCETTDVHAKSSREDNSQEAATKSSGVRQFLEESFDGRDECLHLKDGKLKNLEPDQFMPHGKFSANVDEASTLTLDPQRKAEATKAQQNLNGASEVSKVENWNEHDRRATAVEPTAATDRRFHEGPPQKKKPHAAFSLMEGEENEDDVSGRCVQHSLQFMVEHFNELSQRRTTPMEAATGMDRCLHEGPPPLEKPQEADDLREGDMNEGDVSGRCVQHSLQFMVEHFNELSQRRTTPMEAATGMDRYLHEGPPPQEQHQEADDLREADMNEGDVSGRCVQHSLQFMVEHFNELSQRRTTPMEAATGMDRYLHEGPPPLEKPQEADDLFMVEHFNELSQRRTTPMEAATGMDRCLHEGPPPQEQHQEADDLREGDMNEGEVSGRCVQHSLQFMVEHFNELSQRRTTPMEAATGMDRCLHEGPPPQEKPQEADDLREGDMNEGDVSGRCVQHSLQFMVEHFNELSQRRTTPMEAATGMDRCLHEGPPPLEKPQEADDLREGNMNEGDVSGRCVQHSLQFMVEHFNELSQRRTTPMEAATGMDRCFHEGPPPQEQHQEADNLREGDMNEGDVSGRFERDLQRNLVTVPNRDFSRQHHSLELEQNLNEKARNERGRQDYARTEAMDMDPFSEEARSQLLSLDRNGHRVRIMRTLGNRDESSLRNTLPRRTARPGYFKTAIFLRDSELPDRDNLQEMNIRCVHCGALHFRGEKKRRTNEFDQCCNFGNVRVEIPSYSPVLRELIEGDTQECKEFRSNIRSYNNAFAMASLSAKISLPRGPDPYSFRIHGQVYHTLHRLAASQEGPKTYAQLYFLDTEQAFLERLAHPANRGCSQATMQLIQQELNAINPFIHTFKMMAEVMTEEERRARIEGRPAPIIQMVFDTNAAVDRRRYNAPIVNEIAAVYVFQDGDEPPERQYAIQSRGGVTEYIKDIDPKCDPLCYPLLRPKGEFGWHSEMRKTGLDTARKRTRITQMEYYRYHLAVRLEFNPLLWAGKLFQQYVVDAFVRTEQNRLNFVRSHQGELRAERYNVMVDYMREERNMRIGRRVILPSTFHGSPRSMVALYHDSMAIIARFGKPDLFITFTCNARWREISENLFPHQSPSDRPDIIARVFYLKLTSLLDDVLKKGVFGRTKAYKWVIEFQKRGLPHCHLLVCLIDMDKFRTLEEVDRIIWAHIPNPRRHQRLFNIVTQFNLHGRCGALNREAACMNAESGLCSKHFPKSFCDSTRMDVDGFPEYARPRDEFCYTTPSGEVVNNQWVAPYNWYLSCKYEAHINVELCSTISAVKYLNKYVYKGPDRARVVLQSRQEEDSTNYDEIKAYLDTRYVCPQEATWRLFGFPLHERSHTVVRLPVHLPDQQELFFREGEEVQAVRTAALRDTCLTGWFRLNQSNPEARQYFYREIPEHFRWNSGRWEKRKRQEKAIGRIYTVSPREGERFYLRVMLLYTAGATSFEFLKTINGVQYPSFKEAAGAAGYLRDDEEYRCCLEEASRMAMPAEMRALFAYILSLCEINNGALLWNEFKEPMADDFRAQGLPQRVAEAVAYNQIKEIAVSFGVNITDFIPQPDCEPVAFGGEFVDIAQLREEGQCMYLTLNSGQKHIVDAVLAGEETCFFLDGPGGSGKTYVYNTLNKILRGQGKRVLNVAWSGIAATLLPLGQTVHSAFRLPVPLNDENKTSLMAIQSNKAQELRQVEYIIWDEAPMAPKYALEAVDKLLKDISELQQPFGGKAIILGGDIRQIPPVVPKAGRSEVLNVSIKSSPLWAYFCKYSLTENVRAYNGGIGWSNFLIQLGNGELQNDSDEVQVPDDLLSSGDIVNDIFGDIRTLEDMTAAVGRAILTPKNFDSLEINNKVLSKLPGQKKIYRSIDEVVNDETMATDNTEYSLEFLNSLTPQGYPPHELHLKKGAVVMLLRNLRVSQGLCNGTRLTIEHMDRYILGCKIATGTNKGQYVLIPRIVFCPPVHDTSPCRFKRRQFPVRLAYAMTINKSQGQTFEKVGVYLPSPVFSQGQLYVACSRVRQKSHLKIWLPPGLKTIPNVVFTEMLQ